MITKQMISQGLKEGCVNLIVDPNMQSGTVCKIGEYWFYFGGLTAEELEPDEYEKEIPHEDLVDNIADVLEAFREDYADEYNYYEAYLQEKLAQKKIPALTAYEAYQLQWMIDHGYSLKQFIKALTEFQYADPEDNERISMPLNELFSQWEKDSGFGSERWACEAEWDDAENSNNSMKGALYD